MGEVIKAFIIYIESERGLSKNTIESYSRDLKKFEEYLGDRKISDFDLVDENFMSTYFIHMKNAGKSNATVSRMISTIKNFYGYLFRKGIVKQNPTLGIKSMKKDKFHPRHLSLDEVNLLINSPNKNTSIGKRDKAIIAMIYATGMRVTELINLDIEDLDLSVACIKCRKKDEVRIIPLDKTAKESIVVYIEESREKLIGDKISEALFVNYCGNRMSRQGLWKILKKYSLQANFDFEVSPHLIRHSLAFHLLEKGTDIKSIQELMGHSDLSTISSYRKILKEDSKDTTS